MRSQKATWLLLVLLTGVQGIAQGAAQEDSLHWTWYMSSVQVVPGDTGYIDVIFAVRANSADEVADLGYHEVYGSMSPDLYDFGEAEGKDPVIVESYLPGYSGDEYEALYDPDGPNNWELKGWNHGPQVTVDGIDVAKARYFIKNPSGTSDIEFTSAGVNYAYTESCSVYVSVSFDNSGGDVPLPVVLSSIQARLVAPGVAEVTWSAEAQPSTLAFAVWRSCGGGEYERVGRLVTIASGKTIQQTYTIVDRNVCANQVVLYKIEEVKADGKNVFYGPVVLDKKSGTLPVKESLSVFPNPSAHYTSLRVLSLTRQQLRVDVYNVQGDLVWSSGSRVVNPGYSTLQWPGRDLYGRMVANGIYLICARLGRQRFIQRCVLLR